MKNSDAIISPCKHYRYRLDRLVNPSLSNDKIIAYFGINPSSADAEKDDHTIRKLKKFTILHNGSQFIVGNVFAYRTPHVKNLATVNDLFGKDNDKHLSQIIKEADILIPCWGNTNKVPAFLRP